MLSEPFRVDYFRYYGQASAIMSFGKQDQFSAELSGTFSTPVYQGLYKVGSMGNVSAGLRYTTPNKMTTFSLSISDIFYTNNYRLDVNFSDQRNGFSERAETRLFSVSVRKNFGKSQGRQKRSDIQKNEELDRLKL